MPDCQGKNIAQRIPFVSLYFLQHIHLPTTFSFRSISAMVWKMGAGRTAYYHFGAYEHEMEENQVCYEANGDKIALHYTTAGCRVTCLARQGSE